MLFRSLSDEIERAVLKDGHLEFGLARANQHHESWQTVAPTADKLETMQHEARDSLTAEERIEASNEGSFDAFVDAYINQP